MLNDKDTQDLIKYLTLMTERFSETVGPENFHRMASLEMRAYVVALHALANQRPLKLEVPHDVSKEDLEKALNECSPDYITSDDKLLGEVKMTMPTTDPERCNHIWWYSPETMKCSCSKCHIKKSPIDLAEDGKPPKALIESVAKVIYEAYEGSSDWPWVNYGNSHKQVEAREKAIEAIRRGMK